MLTDRFDAALLFASRLHRSQRRKGSEVPYLAHLLGVAALVLEHGGDEDAAIAALLHDAVEDQGGAATLAQIHSTFGPRVANIVDACTDTDQLPKPPWKARKQAYIDHIATKDADARLVTAADKLHNARSILSDHRRLGGEVWAIFSAPPEEVCWYYRSVTDALARCDKRPIVGELDQAVLALHALAGTQVQSI